MGIIMGTRLVKNGVEVLQTAASLLTAEIFKLTESSSETPAKKIKLAKEPLLLSVPTKCDIAVREAPSIEFFQENHYKPQKPLLLKGIINHWPALEKWKDLNYLNQKAGPRTVPIELGSQYTSDNWSQMLMRFEDFIEHMMLGDNTEHVAYLAQHDLFDQIPELLDDISQPEYILSEEEPRVKAWLGPKGTVSPLHTDPSHNLLCQVFGSKKIILASPESTENLYPHDHFMMNNTSQIDAENLDFEKFPRTRDVNFLQLTLQAGEVLYMPPKWWHHVRSLSPSFSVSYWFE